MAEQHEWQVGELCTCTYGGTGHGVIYRVIDVDNQGDVRPGYWQLTLVPVFAVIAKTKGRGKRKIGAGWCSPKSLVDLASEYAKFGVFIAEEAKRRGADGGV